MEIDSFGSPLKFMQNVGGLVKKNEGYRPNISILTKTTLKFVFLKL